MLGMADDGGIEFSGCLSAQAILVSSASLRDFHQALDTPITFATLLADSNLWSKQTICRLHVY